MALEAVPYLSAHRPLLSNFGPQTPTLTRPPLRTQEARVPVARLDGSAGHKYEYNLTNVEYTEFERLGINDCAAGAEGSQRSVFPANTNVLYVGLRAAASIVQQAVRATRMCA